MDKDTKSTDGKLNEHLANYAEVAECINNLDSNFEELEVILKVDDRLHREIQDEIGLISRLSMVEKTDKFTVNISKIRFTFIK
jgi:hypothetical protein|tara:strand:+ start:197 stop:445 length:249 start_codon:yes stop_codon:yes gene_type:complete